MKKLENELSWSISRAQLFTSCPRAYYYNYYGSWGGWERLAEERTRLLYRLKNIKSLALWAGSIVHDTIKEALLKVSVGTNFTPDALKEMALTRMRASWTEAMHREWLEDPKKTNIAEMYYGAGEDYGTLTKLPKEQTDAVKDKIMGCLDAFASAPLVRQILNTPYTAWLPIDQLTYFHVDDIKVWCAVDFAFRDQQGILQLIDWKTGGENKSSLGQQLACYTLFAAEQWQQPSDKIALRGVFLNDGGRDSCYQVPKDLEEVKNQIRASYKAMKAKLQNPESNTADEEDFPCKPSEWSCRYCSFRQICPALH